MAVGIGAILTWFVAIAVVYFMWSTGAFKLIFGAPDLFLALIGVVAFLYFVKIIKR